MNTGEKLEEMFGRFPGIGRRQAKRFVHFLLGQEINFTRELSENIASLRKDFSQCLECFRFFNGSNKKICLLCDSEANSPDTLIILEKDMDLETVQKSGTYDGRYFVLGGLIPILDKDPTSRIRIKELMEKIKNEGDKTKEVIIALSANMEGENTTNYVRKTLEPFAVKQGFKITTLGRGFSTGLELEYSDADTLKNALKNRA